MKVRMIEDGVAFGDNGRRLLKGEVVEMSAEDASVMIRYNYAEIAGVEHRVIKKRGNCETT